MSTDDSQTSIQDLETEYKSLYSLSSKFCEEVKKQLMELLDQMQVPLAFPIEFRVKEWSSLAGKIEGKELNIGSVKEVNDLIGLRIILLFRSDLPKTYKLIEENFNIIEKEDTERRLRENEFGYISVHYIIELPDSWFAIPTFSSLRGFKSEVQVRTAAQHIWAAASHKLQYKQESGVPIPVKRSIHRVSALLETVDLELDRVLEERTKYIQQVDLNHDDIILNVDLLERILKSLLPNGNLKGPEAYADLLEDLFHFKINTVDKLKSLIKRHLEAILAEENEFVKRFQKNPDPSSESYERINKGVFFTHCGLVRSMIDLEFAEEWSFYSSQVLTERKKQKKLDNNFRK